MYMYIIKVCEYKNNLTFLHKRLVALSINGFLCVTSFFTNLHETQIGYLFLCNADDGVIKEARKIAVWEMTDKFPYAALPYSSRTLYKHFVSAFKLDCCTRESGARNFYKFLACDRSYNAGLGLFDSPPCSDHALVFWQRGTTRRLCVFHPYVYSPEQERELARWCRMRNLTYQIYPEQYSFYYPGHTKLVLVMAKGIWLAVPFALFTCGADMPS